MKIWLVTPEVQPFSKSGGLADVAGALPRALAALGADVSVVSPRYRGADDGDLPLEPMGGFLDVRLGAEAIHATVESSRLPNSLVRVYLIRHDPFYDRDHLYGTPWGDYGDNLRRFALLSRAALELTQALGERPNIFHLHDWQTALAAVYVRTLYSNAFPRARTVMTIHNLAYQGIFSDQEFPSTGLDWRRFNWRELEFYGRVNLLKGGIVYADAVTTVSPTYARQIQEPEFGTGLDGVLRSRADVLAGVINGVDYTLWNPVNDPYLPAHFGAGALDGKAECKAALQREFGLPEEPDAPLIGMVGRFAAQKGFELVVHAAHELASMGVQAAVLGSGDESVARPVMELAGRYPQTFGVRATFDEGMAHRISAGADLFLMPSLYEPCGLGQIYAMKYGTVPVVRATGGLVDTVTDETGFLFDDYHPGALAHAVSRAVDAFRDRAGWTARVKACMAQDFSWSRSARDYLSIFERALAAPARGVPA